MANLGFSGLGDEEQVMKGVFVKNVKIKNVVPIEAYNKSKNWNYNPEYAKDIELAVIYSDGKYEKVMQIKGNVYKNGNGPHHIGKLLDACGIMELDRESIKRILDDVKEGKITDELLELMKGKEIKVLEYIKKNGYYDTWDGRCEGFPTFNVFDANSDTKQVIEEFKKKNKSAYPTEYNPSGLKAREVQDEIPDGLSI